MSLPDPAGISSMTLKLPAGLCLPESFRIGIMEETSSSLNLNDNDSRSGSTVNNNINEYSLATINIPEVMEHVFKYVTAKQLKTYRFVSPAWNQEACRALQKKSHVFLHEYLPRSRDFLELLSPSASSGENGAVILRTPTPFKRLYVSIESFADEILNEIINQKGSAVVELYMNKPPPLNSFESESDFQNKFHNVLMKNGWCLRYLRLSLQDGINLAKEKSQGIGNDNNDQNQELYLPALEDFGFWEYHQPAGIASNKSACINFLLDIIKAAPNLKQLCSSSADPNVMSEILTRSNLSTIQNIYAECVTGKQIQILAGLQLPSLKSLILQSEIDTMPDDQKVSSSVLQNMVRNFSSTLEELNMSWISSSDTGDDDFPVCPKLKKISLDGWYGSLGVFDAYRLPKLESILVVDHQEGDDSIYNPHEGVIKIVVECPQGVGVGSQGGNQGFYSDEEFDSFLFYLRRQFPKTRSLDLTMPLSDEAIRSVIRNLPHLETLILDTKSPLSSHLFTGRNQLILKQFVEEGYNVNEAAIMPSLRDLPNLKKLIVGRYTQSMYPEGLVMTNDMIQYGIAEMPKLNSFQLNWNPELSVDVFSGNLWHLTTIVINNSRDAEVQGAMKELLGCMYQIKLESNTL